MCLQHSVFQDKQQQIESFKLLVFHSMFSVQCWTFICYESLIFCLQSSAGLIHGFAPTSVRLWPPPSFSIGFSLCPLCLCGSRSLPSAHWPLASALCGSVLWGSVLGPLSSVSDLCRSDLWDSVVLTPVLWNGLLVSPEIGFLDSRVIGHLGRWSFCDFVAEL